MNSFRYQSTVFLLILLNTTNGSGFIGERPKPVRKRSTAHVHYQKIAEKKERNISKKELESRPYNLAAQSIYLHQEIPDTNFHTANGPSSFGRSFFDFINGGYGSFGYYRTKFTNTGLPPLYTWSTSRQRYNFIEFLNGEYEKLPLVNPEEHEQVRLGPFNNGVYGYPSPYWFG